MAEWRRQFDIGFPTYFPPLTQLCGQNKIPTLKDNKWSRVRLRLLYYHLRRDATFMYAVGGGQDADRLFPIKCVLLRRYYTKALVAGLCVLVSTRHNMRAQGVDVETSNISPM
jgi:hypothetical protein